MSKKGQLTFRLLMTNLFIVRTASGQFVQLPHRPSPQNQILLVHSNKIQLEPKIKHKILTYSINDVVDLSSSSVFSFENHIVLHSLHFLLHPKLMLHTLLSVVKRLDYA